MSNDTVCAVVVTYNRKKLLIECLESLKKQSYPLKAIYIIDNASTDRTPDFLIKKGYIKELPSNKLVDNWEKCFLMYNSINNNKIRIHYVWMSKNTGGAGGFYEGVKRAYEHGYDWLWLMDDDAEPKYDALEKLSNYFKEQNISALTCLLTDKNGEVLKHHRGYFNFKNVYNYILKPISDINSYNTLEIDHSSFVGLLIRKKSIERIGFPKKEFFIYYDDLEYCIRLRKIGKILVIIDSLIFHPETKSELIERNLLGKTSLRFKYNKFWLAYFPLRNLTWLGKKYSTNSVYFYIGMFKKWIIGILAVIIFDDKKLNRMILLTSAYLNGLGNNFNNEIPINILYKRKKR